MRDPYEVLGVSRSSGMDEIKAAYRNLAKKYHPDNFSGSPLQEVANEKMQEINEAYDAIINGTASAYSSNSYTAYNRTNSDYNYNSYNSRTYNDYTYIENLIAGNRLDDAEVLLEKMPQSSRDARWYFLKGRINYNRGWIDQARTYFATAYNMEPGNHEYRNIFESLNRQRGGGYRTARTSNDSDCSNLLCGLCCADTCCECMGGDLCTCC